ncbi:HAD family hydrolase [Microbacteriaceae bacterium 4G12]
MALLFIFDMDNVLYDYDWRTRMAALSELTGHSVPQLRERWWRTGSEERAEAGGFASAEDYLDSFRAAVGVEVAEEDWVRARGSAMAPFPESLDAVSRAAELGRVTLLTNNGPLTAKHLPRLAPALVPIFGHEHLRTSSQYGARKPDPRVFERVLERYDTAPEDAFFADDLSENVAGAASVGITAHLFSPATGGAGLRDAIERFAREAAARAGSAAGSAAGGVQPGGTEGGHAGR